MKRCDYCGLENEEAASHCSRCGTAEFEERPWEAFWTQHPDPPREQISSSDRRTRFLITTLNAAELDALFGAESSQVAVRLKPLIRKLRHRTNRLTGELRLSWRDVQGINVMAFKPTRRQAEQRLAAQLLRQIFERSLGEGLNEFGQLFRRSNDVPSVGVSALNE
jgi:hypothetical protein